MVQRLVAALFALSSQQIDTTTYKDRATAELVARAQARHAVQDTLVHDYSAVVTTRLDAGFGQRRFSIIPPILAMETVARLVWERPNNLKVNVLGARTATSFRGVRVSDTFDDPWFIPRGLGDSIRFLDDEIPETGALHPLARIGPDYYTYEITDSITISLPEREVRAVGLRVEPKRLAPSLVAGNLWLDAETAEVVRMTIVFVGEFLWERPSGETAEDTASARTSNKWANRLVRIEAELEYGLHESRYWMPYRQLIKVTVELPWFISVRIPVHFLSTFSEYGINTGASPQFTIAPDTAPAPDDSTRWARCRDEDSTRAGCPAGYRGRREGIEKGYTRAERASDGSRWEIATPPRDSLAKYQWPEPLTLAADAAAEQMIRETAATLANISRELPGAWVGRQALGVAWERFSDLGRFNRVQGSSLGAGFRAQPGAFVSVLGGGRYGFSDRRVTGSFTLRRDAPGGRLDIGAWRDVREWEPWTSGLGIGNSFNALLAGHDDADYYLSLGGGLAFTGNHGTFRDLEVGAAFEQTRSMVPTTGSAPNRWFGGTGVFQPNPPVTPGDFAHVHAIRTGKLGSATVVAGADGLFGNRLIGGRGFASVRLPFVVFNRVHALSVRGAATTGDSIAQLRARVGGPTTVRGYDYGTRSGTAMWAAQLDVGLSRRSAMSPVLFADAGNVRGGGDPLVSIGAGVSFFNGVFRFNVAKGLLPRAAVRFDMLFRAPR